MWNPKLCTILGIDLHLHFSFIIAMLAVTIMAPSYLLYIAILFVSVVAHEYGHILAARRYGIGCKQVLITPIGGIAFLEGLPRDPTAELVVVGAGPAVSLVLGLWGIALSFITPFNLFMTFGIVNGALFLFNVLPIFPMDGGRMLRAGLTYTMSYKESTKIATRVGQGMALAVGVLALLSLNFMLALTMLAVGMMGQKELDQISKEKE
jgi:stage IV sporulation protein FB